MNCVKRSNKGRSVNYILLIVTFYKFHNMLINESLQFERIKLTQKSNFSTLHQSQGQAYEA